MFDNLTLKTCVEIQKNYAKLGKEVPFTKKNLCDLLKPYQEKCGLTDREVLSLARNELTLKEVYELIEKHSEPPYATTVAILIENGRAEEAYADGPVFLDIYDVDTRDCDENGAFESEKIRCDFDAVKNNRMFHSVFDN